MNWNFSEVSKSFLKEGKGKLLVEGNFGVEKECQRIVSSGDLALTPHPKVFGDKIKNPRITTDFSESQIEMITPTFRSIEEAYDELDAISIEVENGIDKELLWPLSMPPKLPDEDSIPIARFPDSEDGLYMETYRKGLALRYGKKMQMISGIHYNFSFGEGMVDYLYEQFGNGNDKRSFVDEMHFALARNFSRYRWMLIYLFGASPFCHSTYYPVIDKEIKMIQKCCQCCVDVIENFNQYATSLRVSRFGYSNTFKHRHSIYFNSLEEYSAKLRKMVATKNPEYSKLGTYRNGSQIQLNGNILQKENEFYSSIRLKQNITKGETQLDALKKRGVKYVEVRILDLNPFEKLGLSVQEMYFLQVFMLFCLFEESAPISKEENGVINLNHHLVALFGRKEDLMLQKHDKAVCLKSWGDEIFERLKDVAELIYKGTGDGRYLRSVEEERKKLFDISLLPSERMHREMKRNNENFLEFGTRYAVSNSHKNTTRKA